MMEEERTRTEAPEAIPLTVPFSHWIVPSPSSPLLYSPLTVKFHYCTIFLVCIQSPPLLYSLLFNLFSLHIFSTTL